MQLRARKPPTTKPSGYSASDLRAEGYKDAEIGGITGRSLDWPEQDYNEPDYDEPDEDDHYELETAPAPKKRRAGKKAPLKKGHDDDEVDEDDLDGDDLETAPVPRKKRTQRKTAPLPARLTNPPKQSELATTTPDDVPICMGIRPLELFTADNIIKEFFKQLPPSFRQQIQDFVEKVMQRSKGITVAPHASQSYPMIASQSSFATSSQPQSISSSLQTPLLIRVSLQPLTCRYPHSLIAMKLRPRKSHIAEPSNYSAADLIAEGYTVTEVNRTTRSTSEFQSTSEQEKYSELSEDDVEEDEVPKLKRARASQSEQEKYSGLSETDVEEDEVPEPKRARAPQSKPGNGAPKRKRIRLRPPLKEGQVRLGIPRRARVPVTMPGRVTQPFETSELATVKPDDVPICMGVKPLEPFTAEDILEEFFKQLPPKHETSIREFVKTVMQHGAATNTSQTPASSSFQPPRIKPFLAPATQQTHVPLRPFGKW